MKELEDYPGFPAWLRNFQTTFIGFVVARFNVYGPLIQYLRSLPPGREIMYDLCSGSGEPAISIFRKSHRFNKLVLSDKYPGDFTLQDPSIVYLPAGSDVLEMKFFPGNCYTMFNAFHHFSDDDKVQIVSKIGDSGAEAYFVEILEPGILFLLKILLLTTVGTLLLTPFIRPFSFKRLFFTYLVPVNILTISYDGIVSVLKSRTVEAYGKLFPDLNVFKLRRGLSPLIVIHIQAQK